MERTKASAPAGHVVHDIARIIAEGTYPPQPKLAATLRKLAFEGRESMYHGSLGQSIIDTLAKRGARWSMQQDLGVYHVQRPKHLEASISVTAINTSHTN